LPSRVFSIGKYAFQKKVLACLLAAMLGPDTFCCFSWLLVHGKSWTVQVLSGKSALRHCDCAHHGCMVRCPACPPDLPVRCVKTQRKGSRSSVIIRKLVPLSLPGRLQPWDTSRQFAARGYLPQPEKKNLRVRVRVAVRPTVECAERTQDGPQPQAATAAGAGAASTQISLDTKEHPGAPSAGSGPPGLLIKSNKYGT
jgi:hypothetical protein